MFTYNTEHIVMFTFSEHMVYIVTCQTRTALVKFSPRNLIVYFLGIFGPCLVAALPPWHATRLFSLFFFFFGAYNTCPNRTTILYAYMVTWEAIELYPCVLGNSKMATVRCIFMAFSIRFPVRPDDLRSSVFFQADSYMILY